MVEVGQASLDRELTTVWHGIAGVGGQVEDNLLDLTRIRAHDSWRIPEVRNQRDVVPDDPPQKLVHILEHKLEVEHYRLDRLLAAEGKELVDQPGCPLARLQHLGKIFAAGIVVVERVPHQLAEAAHGSQKVIEVVRNAPGQSPDTLHLLRLAELLVPQA
jgi:hypothetical protein